MRVAGLPVLCALAAFAGCSDDAPWTESGLPASSFLSLPNLSAALSGNVPPEAVDLALRTGAAQSDSTSPFPSAVETLASAECAAPSSAVVSSKRIATGAFPAYEVQASLGCGGNETAWKVVVTAQMRVARASRTVYPASP